MIVSVPLGTFGWWSFTGMISQVPLALVTDRLVAGEALLAV